MIARAGKAADPESQAGGVRRTQRERSTQAEKALMDAAERLFAQRGVDQTSLADVGQEAGYSRGLVNHHFGTKATLVERLARRTQAGFVSAHGEVDGDAIDILVALAERYLAMIDRDGDAARAFFVMWGAALPSDASLRSVFAADDAQFRQGVEAILQHGRDAKSVAADVDVRAGAVAFVGMLRGIAAQHLVDPGAVDITAATRACASFIRRSFAPPQRSTRK
jgi:AcrR family transcriptional regulator